MIPSLFLYFLTFVIFIWKLFCLTQLFQRTEGTTLYSLEGVNAKSAHGKNISFRIYLRCNKTELTKHFYVNVLGIYAVWIISRPPESNLLFAICFFEFSLLSRGSRNE